MHTSLLEDALKIFIFLKGQTPPPHGTTGSSVISLIEGAILLLPL